MILIRNLVRYMGYIWRCLVPPVKSKQPHAGTVVFFFFLVTLTNLYFQVSKGNFRTILVESFLVDVEVQDSSQLKLIL